MIRILSIRIIGNPRISPQPGSVTQTSASSLGPEQCHNCVCITIAMTYYCYCYCYCYYYDH